MNSSQSTTYRRHLIILFLCTFFLFSIGLSMTGLWDFDEGFYAQISLEMRENDDLVFPTFNGAARFDKPPLLYWMIRLLYNLVGVNEWAVRLPSALMGAAVAVVTALFGRRLITDPKKGAQLGLLAGIILSTSVVFFILARMGMMDVGLTLFVALALYAFTHTWRGGYGGWIAAGLWTGFGILMKGPVAAIIVGMTVVLFTIAEERWAGLVRLVRHPGPWLAAAAALILAAPWHIAMTARVGGDFWSTYVGFHQVGLFTSEFADHGGPWYYHLVVMALGMMPWSPVIPWLRRRHFSSDADVDGRVLRLLGAWLIGTVVFFSASATKAPAYTLPAFPAAALFLAQLWLRWGGSRERWLTPSLFTALFAALVAAAINGLKKEIPLGYEEAADILVWIPLAIMVIAGAAVLAGSGRVHRRRWHLGAAAVNAAVLSLTLALVLMPALDDFKPQRTLAPAAAQLAADLDTRFGSVFGRGGDASTRFYAAQSVVYVQDLDQATDLLLAEDRPILLALQEDLAPLQQRLAPASGGQHNENRPDTIDVLRQTGNGVLLRRTADP